jgi:hypothetical protein
LQLSGLQSGFGPVPPLPAIVPPAPPVPTVTVPPAPVVDGLVVEDPVVNEVEPDVPIAPPAPVTPAPVDPDPGASTDASTCGSNSDSPVRPPHAARANIAQSARRKSPIGECPAS